MASVAQELFNDGIAKGKAEVALKMLEEKVDIAFIAKITGYSVSRIKELEKAISKAK